MDKDLRFEVYICDKCDLRQPDPPEDTIPSKACRYCGGPVASYMRIIPLPAWD